MSLAVGVSTFALLFTAELGDKSQLVAIGLANRHATLPVFIGIAAAFLLLDLLAVILGATIHELLPLRWLLMVASTGFIGLGIHTWGHAGGEEEVDVSRPPRRAWVVMATAFVLILLAELGDKTQLVLISTVAATGEPFSVLVGGTLALWTVSLLGIMAGATLLRRLPARWVHKTAAVLFIVFGILGILQATRIFF